MLGNPKEIPIRDFPNFPVNDSDVRFFPYREEFVSFSLTNPTSAASITWTNTHPHTDEESNLTDLQLCQQELEKIKGER